MPALLCERAARFIPCRSTAHRAADGEAGDGHTLSGYCAVFGVVAGIHTWEGHFNETIARGSFRKTLSERVPVLQFDHGHDVRVGTTPIGHFNLLHEDRHGLFVEARLFDNPVVEPVRQAIEAQAINGMSFRFVVIRDEWTDKNGKKISNDELIDLLWSPGSRGPLNRTIREVKLFEAGPVVFPAYETTSVDVRALSQEDRRALLAQHLRITSSPPLVQRYGLRHEVG